MATHTLDPADRHTRIGVIDIETNGLDARSSTLVAIGLGYYEPGFDGAEVAVPTRRSTGNDELALIETAAEWFDDRSPEVLVTFNGASFDLPFIADRLAFLDGPTDPFEGVVHLDLLSERKRAAPGARWPSLEDCLDAYGLPVVDATWEDRPLDNRRFGEELAPRYLSAIELGAADAAEALEAVIGRYAAADVEATVALHEADANRSYTPEYDRCRNRSPLGSG